MSGPRAAGMSDARRCYARLTTLTGFAAFFVFLPLALVLPFLQFVQVLLAPVTLRLVAWACVGMVDILVDLRRREDV